MTLVLQAQINLIDLIAYLRVDKRIIANSLILGQNKNKIENILKKSIKIFYKKIKIYYLNKLKLSQVNIHVVNLIFKNSKILFKILLMKNKKNLDQF